MRRTNIDKVRESLRLQQVYNVFLRYGWDSAIQSLGPINDFRRKMQKWIWDLPEEVKSKAMDSLENKFRFLFEKLGVFGTKQVVDRYIKPVKVPKRRPL